MTFVLKAATSNLPFLSNIYDPISNQWNHPITVNKRTKTKPTVRLPNLEIESKLIQKGIKLINPEKEEEIRSYNFYARTTVDERAHLSFS